MQAIEVVSIPLGIQDFKDYCERVLSLKPLIDCLDDGRKHAEIRAPEVFRSTLYSICSGLDSINRIDQHAKDKNIFSVTGTKGISARTIGRSYSGMQEEQLSSIMIARSRAEIKTHCDHSCNGQCIFDMSQQFGKKAVVATYWCAKHNVIASVGVEFLTESESKDEEKQKGEGESKAAKRLLPKVEHEFGEWVYEYVADGYYTYWFAEMVRKFKKHFTLKTHEENLLIVQQANEQIQYLYESGMKAERLTPCEWVSDDRYKKYKGFDTDLMNYQSDTGKSPYEGMRFRVVKTEEEYLWPSQRKRGTEKVYTMTSISCWEADIRKISQTRRDEWRIEINIFKELSEKMASKVKDHFFKKDDNSKKCIFLTALIARDLLYGYRQYKLEKLNLTARQRKMVTLIRISNCLLNTWLPKKSGRGRPQTRQSDQFINIYRLPESGKSRQTQQMNN